MNPFSRVWDIYRSLKSLGDRLSTAWVLVFLVGPVILIGLAVLHLTQGAAEISPPIIWEALFQPRDSLAHAIVRYVRLPRLAVGMLAGSALAAAGVLMQTITRNPLASPATLGVNAGAYLALVAAAVFFPTAAGSVPLLITFAGGMLAAVLAYSIAASGGRATPVRLALSGVAVSLAFGAVTGTLQLLYENETAGLFFWGAGSLAQQDWAQSLYALPRVALGILSALLLARQLDVLRLGDDLARSLGQKVSLIRLTGTLLGVFLAAAAVTIAGPIGFVGLVVPHIIRLLGITNHRQLLAGASIWGAVVLIGADVTARLVSSGINELPAGVVTALIGTPFFIWLARQAPSPAGEKRQPGQSGSLTRSTPLSPPVIFMGTGVLLTAALGIALLLGEVPLTWSELLLAVQGRADPLTRQILFNLRLPRVLVAAAAGASLSVSGVLLQGVVRNPLAAPSVLGVTSGAGLGGLLLLIALPDAPVGLVPAAAFLGAAAAFAVVYAFSWQREISSTRLALVGIAVSAFCGAFISLLIVRAGVRVAVALVWLSGSVYARGWAELLHLAAWPMVLIPLARLFSRQLDLIGLGDEVSRGLGLPLERSRLILLGTAVLLAAASVATVGTISFVGLITPHAARLLVGSRHRQLIPLAAALGAALVVAADTAGRTLLAPRQIPAGLVTALIGAPYFLWLLWNTRQQPGT